MARVVKQQKGVLRVAFDKHKVELSVVYHREQTAPPALIKAVADMGFVALPGAGQGKYKPPVKFAKGLDVKYIAKNGEAVDFKSHAVPGKVTVFDFYAVWCGPCKDVDYTLLEILKKNPKLALRKINVVDWNRPVAKQHLKGISQLPYLVIYDTSGKKAKVIVGRKLKLLKETIDKLSR